MKYPSIYLEGLRKLKKTSVRIAGIRADHNVRPQLSGGELDAAVHWIETVRITIPTENI
jgi:hypothetical protein